jgi:hypothetical protein
VWRVPCDEQCGRSFGGCNLEYVVKILFLIQFTCVIFCDAEDVLGCGGYVKSDIDIIFSQVEVKL